MPDITVEGMFHTDPLIKLAENIDIPGTSGLNAMYNVEPPNQITGVSSQQIMQNGVCNGVEHDSSDELQNLSARQEAVMQRLLGLQLQLEQLKAFQDERNGAALQDERKGAASVSSPVTNLPQFKAGVCHDIVISASPFSPPYGVLAFAAALRKVGYTVLTTTTTHSSLDIESFSPPCLWFKSANYFNRAEYQVILTIVWSDVPALTLMVDPLSQCCISGEGNVLRYLSRLLPASSPYHYEGDASFAAIAYTDLILDDCTAVLAAARLNKGVIGHFVQRVEETLRMAPPETGAPAFSVVGDVAVYSALRQLVYLDNTIKLPPATRQWYRVVDHTILEGSAQ